MMRGGMALDERRDILGLHRLVEAGYRFGELRILRFGEITRHHAGIR